MERFREDQLEAVVLHLSCLVFADGGFQSQQVFGVDAFGFGQNLTPAFLAGAFYSQHG